MELIVIGFLGAVLLVIIWLWLRSQGIKYYVKVDDTDDYCFTVEAPFQAIKTTLKEEGYELSHVLQHIIETKYGVQKLGARRVVGGKQFHVRLYEVGEDLYRVYCHFEWTPEFKPYEHYIGQDYEIACEEVEIIFLEELTSSLP